MRIVMNCMEDGTISHRASYSLSLNAQKLQPTDSIVSQCPTNTQVPDKMRDPPSDHQWRNSSGGRRAPRDDSFPGHWAKLDFEIQEALFVDHIGLFVGELPLPSTSIPWRVLCLPVLE